MATSSSTDNEPRVLQLAYYDVPFEQMSESDLSDHFLYLQVLTRLSTFLLQNTADLADGAEPFEDARRAHDPRSPQDLQLRHAKLQSLTCPLRPERDMLWISDVFDKSDLDDLDELKLYYGSQLNAIQRVLFEGSKWEHIKECLKLMKHFSGVKIIYVWLDSYRFLVGEPVSTEQEYRKQAKEFQTRDTTLLRGRDLVIKYIDDKKNIYGSLRV